MFWMFAQVSGQGSALGSLSLIEKFGIIGALVLQIGLTLKVMHLLWTRNEKRDEQHRKELDKRDERIKELQTQNALLHQTYGEAMIQRERAFSTQAMAERDEKLHDVGETMRDVCEALEVLNGNLLNKPRRGRVQDVAQRTPGPIETVPGSQQSSP